MIIGKDNLGFVASSEQEEDGCMESKVILDGYLVRLKVHLVAKGY